MEAKRPTFDAAHSPNMRRVHKAKHADPTASTASTALDGAVRQFERARDNAVKAIDTLSSSVANVVFLFLEGQTSLAKAFVFHPSENSPQVDAFVANGLDVVLHAGAGGSVPVKPNRKIPKVAKVPRPSQVLA
ncbi:hypothetical protein DYB37_004995 [Aphanomyces astaci]|uniref:Uncharacterized protein n=1 Tax=Aphanomyces astaci TaxID=112090 RepID=A0A3R6ZNF2_APHAT|nr:hypothetical protein DYB35_004281 [Aphanomyces astaci]RHZ18956.1 hypothetical protein DYB37_004995 [Aphanomyces astaci]